MTTRKIYQIPSLAALEKLKDPEEFTKFVNGLEAVSQFEKAEKDLQNTNTSMEGTNYNTMPIGRRV